ncbi:MAG: hypothetical protein BLITH_1456 [Brockia lithotrophica]|uniref:Uncharacterized protein n=1 Tax=Brockia lithotrophica TaxID=933949 RepID=A0A2T5G407_9BACL|nr:MAG: hypothetical protein BLITH_1456 [Brockia lithotrophica]
MSLASGEPPAEVQEEAREEASFSHSEAPYGEPSSTWTKSRGVEKP